MRCEPCEQGKRWQEVKFSCLTYQKGKKNEFSNACRGNIKLKFLISKPLTGKAIGSQFKLLFLKLKTKNKQNRKEKITGTERKAGVVILSG